MTGYCVKGKHQKCPDTKKDTYVCSCPCHLSKAAALRKAADERQKDRADAMGTEQDRR